MGGCTVPDAGGGFAGTGSGAGSGTITGGAEVVTGRRPAHPAATIVASNKAGSQADRARTTETPATRSLTLRTTRYRRRTATALARACTSNCVRFFREVPS